MPYVPSLVDKFVTLLSSLEPEVVNYLHLNADKYNTTGEDIDRMRLSNVRGSPMMDAIERCLDLLDGETMKSFIPQLQKTIRKALGLPSKVSQIFSFIYSQSGASGRSIYTTLVFQPTHKNFTNGLWNFIIRLHGLDPWKQLKSLARLRVMHFDD